MKLQLVQGQKPTSDYVKTHCTTCAAGWTRTDGNAEVIFCLLDREPVWPEMQHCSRYEPEPPRHE